MANIVISHLAASNWTALYAPTSCDQIVIENSDPAYGFSVRTISLTYPHGNGDSQRDIRPGCGVEITGDRMPIQPETLLLYVKANGPDATLILTAGMGLSMSALGGNGSNGGNGSAAALASLATDQKSMLEELQRIRFGMQNITQEQLAAADAADL
jgi:hypothetical protein